MKNTLKIIMMMSVALASSASALTVFDPTAYVKHKENAILLEAQKGIQTQISNFTGDILNIDKLIQEVTGDLQSTLDFKDKLAAQINAIPQNIQYSVSSILGVNDTGINPLAKIGDELLDNFMGIGEYLFGESQQAVEEGRFDSGGYASATNYSMSAAILAGHKDQQKKIDAMRDAAKSAKTTAEQEHLQTQIQAEQTKLQQQSNAQQAAAVIDAKEQQAKHSRESLMLSRKAAFDILDTYIE